MKRLHRNHDAESLSDSEEHTRAFSRYPIIRKCPSDSMTIMRLTGFFLFSLILLSVLFSLSLVLRDPPSDAALTTTPLLQLKQTHQGSFLLIFITNFFPLVVDVWLFITNFSVCCACLAAVLFCSCLLFVHLLVFSYYFCLIQYLHCIRE